MKIGNRVEDSSAALLGLNSKVLLQFGCVAK